jgi:hypothetical protein
MLVTKSNLEKLDISSISLHIKFSGIIEYIHPISDIFNRDHFSGEILLSQISPDISGSRPDISDPLSDSSDASGSGVYEKARLVPPHLHKVGLTHISSC